MGEERVSERKSMGGEDGEECAVLKILLKSPSPGTSLILRQIDALVMQDGHCFQRYKIK